jgi:iron(III) transport system ATP-binding protein
MVEATVLCEEIGKSFGAVAVVSNVSFGLESGEILALLGPSGCGKTTTLRLIAGFEQIDSGRIAIGDQVVADGRFHLPPEKRRVGMVFQDYAIFPHLSVAQNVAFGLGRGETARRQTEIMLDMVGLRGLDRQMPHELSGGQQQRVALARALAPEPAVLLLDEPFSNLDTTLRVQVRQEVRELLKQSKATAIFVTHDQEEALFIGDRVAVMNQGRLEQIGTPYEIFHRPLTRFVADFIGETDFLPGTVASTGVETSLGSLDRHLDLPQGTAVSVAVRPDDVTFTPSANGNGRVVARRFTGIANVYRLRLNDGSEVHSWQPHTVEVAPGTAVQASIRPDHPITYFQGDRAVR